MKKMIAAMATDVVGNTRPIAIDRTGQLRLISDLAVTDRAQYSALVRSRFLDLEDQFMNDVKKMPNPTEKEATRYLAKVSVNSWNCLNEVKTGLITKVSENTVLATGTLGRD